MREKMKYYDASGPYSNALSHYGIPGMKWGIRRFQNKDGSLTSAGRKRRQSKTNRKQKNPPTHEDLIRSTDPRLLYKYRDQLSDRELQDRLNRIQSEERLKAMAKNMESGKKHTFPLLKKIGQKTIDVTATAIVGATVGTLASIGMKEVKSAMADWGGEFVNIIKGDWDWIPKP